MNNELHDIGKILIYQNEKGDTKIEQKRNCSEIPNSSEWREYTAWRKQLKKPILMNWQKELKKLNHKCKRNYVWIIHSSFVSVFVYII